MENEVENESEAMQQPQLAAADHDGEREELRLLRRLRELFSIERMEQLDSLVLGDCLNLVMHLNAPLHAYYELAIRREQAKQALHQCEKLITNVGKQTERLRQCFGGNQADQQVPAEQQAANDQAVRDASAEQKAADDQADRQVPAERKATDDQAVRDAPAEQKLPADRLRSQAASASPRESLSGLYAQFKPFRSGLGKRNVVF